MAKNSFSIGDAVKYGWRKATGNISFFVVLFLIFIVVNVAPAALGALFQHLNISILSFAAQLVGWALQLTMSLGLINVALRLHDNKKANYKNLFDHVHLVIPYFLTSIIYGLIVFVGFILLIVPGIVWSIKFRYFPYLMVDRNLGPIDALKESAKMTRGFKWKIFWFGVVIALINILGFLALIVGLFITVPLSMMAEAWVYRKLTAK